MKLFAIFSIITLMSQCNKYDNTIEAKKIAVPDYTEKGANTFGCLVNGAPWENFGETWVNPGEGFGHLDSNKVRAGFFYDSIVKDSVFSVSGTLTISKQGNAIREEIMSLYIPKHGNLKGVHTDARIGYNNLLSYYGYGTYPPHTFTATVKKDSIQGSKHIISGTFNGMAFNALRADSIRIVGGVFDTTVRP